MSRITSFILAALLAMLFSPVLATARAQDNRFGPPPPPPQMAPGFVSPLMALPFTDSPEAGDGDLSTSPLSRRAFGEATDPTNPLAMLARAGAAIPGAVTGGVEEVAGSTTEGARGLSPALNIVVVLTVLSLVPSIMLMTTCFMRIVIVLGLLKQALGTQQLPPSQVITGLALVMTMVVMAPTIDRINTQAIAPYRAGQISGYDELWDKAKEPIREFMFDQIERQQNYSSLLMVMNYRGIDTSDPSTLTRDHADMLTLIPAFMLSELKTAFLMGFKIYLPFLVIDMVISSLLVSMSMMMLPPVLISLPFKLLLFVLVDGWALIVGGLMQSFVVRSAQAAMGVSEFGFA